MLTIAEFDFQQRQYREITAGEVAASRQAGRFCWVDAAAPTEEEVIALFETFPVNAGLRAEILGAEHEGCFDVYEDALHFSMTEAFLTDGRIATAHVETVMAATFLLTFHRREALFIRRVRGTVIEDFAAFARSPGFLLYELGDHLISQYRRSLQDISDAVEYVQQRLFGRVDDVIFKDVAALASTLGDYRRILLAARELMHQLATRRSPYISDTTRPFLARMAVTLERLDGDLNSERQLLNETLNLYLGMVGHRTNKVVNRLTVINIIFLPLMFLCGVYGMNFTHLPETQWTYGYLFFWGLVAAIVTGLLLLLRKLRWL
jgi:magnesium transporter